MLGRSVTRMHTPQLETEARSGLMRKVAALLEVLGVFIAGSFTASYLDLAVALFIEFRGRRLERSSARIES